MPSDLRALHIDVTLVCSFPLVQSNGFDFIKLEQSLHIEEASKVHALSPSCGPSLGGTLVHVTVSPLWPRTHGLHLLACNVDNVTVMATAVNQFAILCVTPRLFDYEQWNVSRRALEITTNMQEFSASGVLFEYHSIEFLQVIPASGPILGNERVTIAVRGRCSPDTKCIFGDQMPVPAHIDSIHTISCLVPRANTFRQGHATIRFTTSGILHKSVLSYAYHWNAELLSLRPSSAPIRGGVR